MRRLIQSNGAEVVHLGHNRSVRDVVRAAIQREAIYQAVRTHLVGLSDVFTLHRRRGGRVLMVGDSGITIRVLEVLGMAALVGADRDPVDVGLALARQSLLPDGGQAPE